MTKPVIRRRRIVDEVSRSGGYAVQGTESLYYRAIGSAILCASALNSLHLGHGRSAP